MSEVYDLALRRRRSEEYAGGLRKAFNILSERIIGEPTWVRFLPEEEPDDESQHGDSSLKK
jgi:hypothetical protein